MAETVLIVEDVPEFAELVELWVGQAGFRTVTARTGPDALRRFYDERPDLVVLDVALPGLDGWQLLERLREFSRVPIIMRHGTRLRSRQDPWPEARRRRLHHEARCRFPELIARVEAALRRAANERRRSGRASAPSSASSSSTSTTIERTCAASRSHLTPTEFRLLAYLVEHSWPTRHPSADPRRCLGRRLRP